ncbi:MAG: bacteriohemerythrin [Clostridia bacterium]|nr:bacteriohemerythrin [Clostridia bacterium]
MGRLVIIEDVEILKLRLEKALEDNGIKGFETMSNHQVRTIRSNIVFKEASLVIIDLDNQDLDLQATIESIREHSSQINIPILVLSKNSDLNTLNKAISLGCTDFILKPFTNETFIRKVVLSLSKKDLGQVQLGHDPRIQHVEEGIHMLKWNSGFEIGVQSIDEDHKKIIEHFEKLYLLMKSGQGHAYYPEFLEFLEDYVDTHFEREETLQREIGYDDYEQHLQLHNDFKIKVKELIMEHGKDVVTNSDLIKINLFIKDWLIHHILLVDNKIGLFMNSRK